VVFIGTACRVSLPRRSSVSFERRRNRGTSHRTSISRREGNSRDGRRKGGGRHRSRSRSQFFLNARSLRSFRPTSRLRMRKSRSPAFSLLPSSTNLFCLGPFQAPPAPFLGFTPLPRLASHERFLALFISRENGWKERVRNLSAKLRLR